MKLPFILLLITSVISFTKLFGQNHKNPDRYINAYKQYLNEKCPIEKGDIKHYVYFARDRHIILDHPFLNHSRFEGAQIMYAWEQLEPEKGKYDFTKIREDYEYLLSFNKKLFIQFQDITFNPHYKGIPQYLNSEEYNGGSSLQYNDKGKPEGWVAKKWNKQVQERFKLLMVAIGEEFDGKIAGINLQESAVGVNGKLDTTFTHENYLDALKINMLALKQAFPTSVTMQYANFMPGEWLPWEDNGFLLSIYQHAEKIGVGLGAPDLMVQRRGQLNHAIAMMHEYKYTVPLGIAIQDGNYIGMTGADYDYDEKNDMGLKNRRNIVPLLYAFAKHFMGIDYMFWVHQEPYFSEDVLTCFTSED